MLIEAPILAAREIEWADEESPAMVGPHAVLHAADVIRERLGDEACREILADAQVHALPTGDSMIPEIEALRVHRWLALREPVACFELAEQAARRTADYIIANRIPRLAAWLLKVLPPSIAAVLLMEAIRRHAWTFVGAGHLEVRSGWQFVIDRSEVDDLVAPPESLFHWYGSVFARLYGRLVSPNCQCVAQPLPSKNRTAYSYRLQA